MKTKFLSLLAASFLFAACGKEEHVHTPGDGHSKEAGHVDDHGGGGHGAMVSLGSIQLGGVAVEVEQEGAMEPGKELGVEISFAKDKPITLLNGRELLGLLEQHGYKFRINLAEAKALLG